MSNDFCQICGSKMSRRSPYIEKRLGAGNILVDCEYQYCPHCGWEDVSPDVRFKVQEELQKEIDNYFLILYEEDGLDMFVTIEQLSKTYDLPKEIFSSERFLNSVYHTTKINGSLLFLKESLDDLLKGGDGQIRVKFGSIKRGRCTRCGSRAKKRKGWILQDDQFGNVIVDEPYRYCPICGIEEVGKSIKDKALMERQKRIASLCEREKNEFQKRLCDFFEKV